MMLPGWRMAWPKMLHKSYTVGATMQQTTLTHHDTAIKYALGRRRKRYLPAKPNIASGPNLVRGPNSYVRLQRSRNLDE
jgi:hypothetical protein